MHPRNQLRRNASGWWQLIERYEQSDVTLKAFCAQEGISRSAFYAWRKRLREADEAQTVSGCETTAPMKIKTDEVNADTAAPHAAAATQPAPKRAHRLSGETPEDLFAELTLPCASLNESEPRAPNESSSDEPSPARSQAHIQTLLDGRYSGVLLTDGYIAYEKYSASQPTITHAQCWAHARRMFERARGTDAAAEAALE